MRRRPHRCCAALNLKDNRTVKSAGCIKDGRYSARALYSREIKSYFFLQCFYFDGGGLDGGRQEITSPVVVIVQPHLRFVLFYRLFYSGNGAQFFRDLMAHS